MELLNFYRTNFKIDHKSNNKLDVRPLLKFLILQKAVSWNLPLFSLEQMVFKSINTDITYGVPKLAKHVISPSKN